MRIYQIDHVQIAMPVGGESQARAFYGDVLGIPETPKPNHLATRGGAWFESDQLKVHLGVDKNFVPATKAHIAFLTEDIGCIRRMCSEAGYDVIEDQPLEGYERIYVSDPFGNRLEFMEPLSQ